MDRISIELKNINLRINNIPILKDISFSIPEEKTTCIVGPSGCGKSILLKIAAGLVPIDSGKVLINDIDINKLSKKELLSFRKLNGFVFQDSALWANKTVRQNLSLPLQFHFPKMKEEDIENRILDFVKKVGYKDSLDLRPAELSIGETRMISFVRAIITDPLMMFMDSPLNSVDLRSARKMISWTKHFKENKKTIVASSTNFDELAEMADFLIIIKKGELLATGSPDELKSSSDKKIKKILGLYDENDIGSQYSTESLHD